MKNLCHALLAILFVVACKEDPIVEIPKDDFNPTDTIAGNENPDSIPNSSLLVKQLTGLVQKGPFNNGTSIEVSELNELFGQTGRTFKSEINNNYGGFMLSNIELESEYALIQANGFYFNECTGENSEAPLILNALTTLNDTSTVNINILSHLEKDRLLKLIEDGQTYIEAKKQTQQEIRAIFEISDSAKNNSEYFDITQEGDDNAILLAISAILQTGNSTSDLSKLIADIKTDLYDNGLLDSDSIGDKLLTQAVIVNKQQIRKNLENKCSKESIDATIPAFENYIDNFIEKSGYTQESLITYPDSTYFGKNILHENIDTVYYGNVYCLAANMATNVKCKIVVKGIGFAPHLGSDTPHNCTLEGTSGFRTFQSLPGVKEMKAKAQFEDWDADENGISHYTIEFYEGINEFKKTHTKQIVAIYKDFSYAFHFPEIGQYGENILTMEESSLTFVPGTKYSVEFEMYEDLDIQCFFMIHEIDTSKVIVRDSDNHNFDIQRHENSIRFGVINPNTSRKYSLSVQFTDHGTGLIYGRLKVVNGAQKHPILQIVDKPISW